MAFEYWEIAGGQLGEGSTVHEATYRAIGRAIGHMTVRDLRPGDSLDLTYPGIGAEVRLDVVGPDLAFCCMVPLRQEDLSIDMDAEPRLAIVSEDSPVFPINLAWTDEETERVKAYVFGVVRQVESTPSWTKWLPSKV